MVAISDKSLRIEYTNEKDTTYKYLYAYVKNNSDRSCSMDEGGSSCEIRGLSPYTNYTVEIIGCTDRSNRDTCSDPVGKSGHTKPSGELTDFAPICRENDL